MRWTWLLTLCLWPHVVFAQPASPEAQGKAKLTEACKSICEKGDVNKLSVPEEKSLYFTCFIQGFCGNCKEPSASSRICNPIASQPPSGSPLDIFQRPIFGPV